MTEVLQANIFFMITSVAVVLFTLLLCIALYHIIKILRSVRSIVDKVESGSEVIAEDISNLREYIADGGLVSSILGIFLKQSSILGGAKKDGKKKDK